jgi:hypothetical protein
MNMLFKHTLVLVAAAIVAPMLFGLIARSLFFRRDTDDVRNFHGIESAQHSEREIPNTPEPEPVRRQPWPDFPPSFRAADDA